MVSYVDLPDGFSQFNVQDWPKYFRHPYAGVVHVERPANTDYFPYEHALFKEKYSSVLGTKAKRKYFNIGIFGGSVGIGLYKSFMMDREYWENKIKRSVPWLKDIPLHWYNFSITGGKRAQQFGVFHANMDVLDVSINLDGFNDLDLISNTNYPLVFPNQADGHFSRRNVVSHKFTQFYYLTKLRRLVSALPLKFLFLQNKYFYYLFWHAADYYLAVQAHHVSGQLYFETNQSASEFYRNHQFSLEEKYKKASKLWSKFIRVQNILAQSYGVIDLSFFQPNQYYNNRKEFNAEERKTVLLRGESYQKNINVGLKYFLKEIDELKNEKREVIDLTHIFKNTHKMVYSDDCCHIHEIGYRPIKELIIDTLIHELTLKNKNYAEKFNAN